MTSRPLMPLDYAGPIASAVVDSISAAKHLREKDNAAVALLMRIAADLDHINPEHTQDTTRLARVMIDLITVCGLAPGAAGDESDDAGVDPLAAAQSVPLALVT